MVFKELALFTNKFHAEKKFYSETLGFTLQENTESRFTVAIGKSKLTFVKSEESSIYHYCFLIPCNQLEESIQWLKKRLEPVQLETGAFIQWFETWNAHSVYFYDGSGNIAEFIVRHDLKNESSSPFDINSIISVNEIGMPTNNIKQLSDQLSAEMGTEFWKGSYEYFGTHGNQEGLFLLPNFEHKKIWYPTQLPVKTSPFKARVTNNGQDFSIQYSNNMLEINKL